MTQYYPCYERDRRENLIRNLREAIDKRPLAVALTVEQLSEIIEELEKGNAALNAKAGT